MSASPHFVAALAALRASVRPVPPFRFVSVGRSGRWFRVVGVPSWWRVWGVPLVVLALVVVLVVFAGFVFFAWGPG